MDAWQKCPVCEGTGDVHAYLHLNKQCKVCQGYGIISTANGRPPIFNSGYTTTVANYPTYFTHKTDNPETKTNG